MNVKPAYAPPATPEGDEMCRLLSGQKLRTVQDRVKHRVATHADTCMSELLTIELMMRPA
ncbi:MAG: hypothetical protein ACTS2F_10205 [Thainema sp.]